MAPKECCAERRFRDKVCVEKLQCQAIVGVKEPERMQRQKLLIDVIMYLDVSCCSLRDSLDRTISYATVAREVLRYTEESKHYLLETLAHGIARLICMKYDVPEVLVRIEKPRAIPLADQAVVEIVRTRDFFSEERAAVQKRQTALSCLQAGNGEQLVFLALGSNVGDPLKNLFDAVAALKVATGAKVVATSGLFCTPPTYNVEQAPFLNAVVALATALDPYALLRQAKTIEGSMGRDPDGPRNSPRVIDIDIILHGDSAVDSATLCVPHREMHKRLFVMLPLMDVARPDTEHPVLRRPLTGLLDSLLMSGAVRVKGEEDPTDLSRAVPTRSGAWQVGIATRVVALASSAAEVEAARAGGAGGVLCASPTLLEECAAACEAPGLRVFCRVGSVAEVAKAMRCGADGLFLADALLADDATLRQVADALAASRACAFITARSGQQMTSLERLQHAVGTMQAAGMLRWQVVMCPDLAASPEPFLKGTEQLHAWYPQCWELHDVAFGAKRPSLAVLAQSAIQNGAALVVVPAGQVAQVVEVADTADTLFRKPEASR